MASYDNMHFEWLPEDGDTVYVIGRNSHLTLGRVRDRGRWVAYVYDGPERHYCAVMPKGSTVQWNRAKRYHDHFVGLREGKCPFAQNENGMWVRAE